MALMVGVLMVAAYRATKQASTRHIPARPTTIGVADNGSPAGTLAHSPGRTRYRFKADGTVRSTRFGACATAWLPLRVHGNPTVSGGANTSLVATIARPEGVARGHLQRPPPLPVSGRHAAQAVSGRGVIAFGAKWVALSPAGTAIRTQPSSTASSGEHRSAGLPQTTAPQHSRKESP
jgi:predicted lipoprotein with Yx(FWY)xxD motif